MSFDWNSVGVTGGAYVLSDSCGAIGQPRHFACAGPRAACRLLENQGRLKALPRNFGRFDTASLFTLASALWACVDAGLPLTPDKRRIGIVGSSPEGALNSNRAFYADYVDAGRKSARSSLFVYTLPTTPLAETALFLGLTGPLWYMYSPAGGPGRLLEEAGIVAAGNDLEAMLAVCSDGQAAVCLVVQKTAAKVLFPMSWIQAHLKTVISVQDLIHILNPTHAK